MILFFDHGSFVDRHLPSLRGIGQYHGRGRVVPVAIVQNEQCPQFNDVRAVFRSDAENAAQNMYAHIFSSTHNVVLIETFTVFFFG